MSGPDRSSYRRATIPLPVADNRGVPFLPEDVDWFEQALLRIGSGFWKHLRTEGVWDSGGFVYREPVAVYVTTLPVERLGALKALLDQACQVFRQEAILLEITDVDAIFATATGQAAYLLAPAHADPVMAGGSR